MTDSAPALGTNILGMVNAGNIELDFTLEPDQRPKLSEAEITRLAPHCDQAGKILATDGDPSPLVLPRHHEGALYLVPYKRRKEPQV